MSSVHEAAAHPEPRQYAPMPPVAELSTVALGLVIIGGILMAAHAPRRPPLVLPTLLAAAATVLFAVAWAMLLRLRHWPRHTFVTFFKWALLAYVISAGMIGFAFVKDRTRGAPLAVLLWLLVLFATTVPTIIGFTVARYDQPSPAEGAAGA